MCHNSLATYSKELAFLIGIQVRGPVLQNVIKTPTPADLWPLTMDENCDALWGMRRLLAKEE